MIVYYKHNEIDRKQWDVCIRNISDARPYAYSWYLDIMVPGWEALVDDDYDSVFPIPAFSRFGIHYIATPVFLQQLGAFSPDKDESDAIIEFLHYIPDNYRFIDLCVGQKVAMNGYSVTSRVNFELDLSRSYGILWNNFSHHCKRNIEISEKNKPELVSDINPKDLIDLFLENRGKEIKGIKTNDYKRLYSLMDFCLKNKKGSIVGVRNEKKKLIFGVFIIDTQGRKTMLFVVNTQESRTNRINYYVINKIIKENSSTKGILDFAGSSVPSIAAFMESFGCIGIPYYRIYRNRLFWPAKMMK